MLLTCIEGSDIARKLAKAMLLGGTWPRDDDESWAMCGPCKEAYEVDDDGNGAQCLKHDGEPARLGRARL